MQREKNYFVNLFFYCGKKSSRTILKNENLEFTLNFIGCFRFVWKKNGEIDDIATGNS